MVAASKSLRDAYVPVAVSTLLPSAVTGFSLYVPDEDRVPKLYRDESLALERKDLDRLEQRGIKTLLLRSDHFARYQNYLRDNLDDLLADESMPVDERFGLLNQVVRDVLAGVIAKGDVGTFVETSGELANETVEFVCRHDANAGSLFRMFSHDASTFTHVANVSYYCVMLAKQVGIDSEDDLREIAAGGLLHDIGKLEIPDHILSKPGKLTEAEIAVVRRHPKAGLEMLRDRDDVSFGQLMMVYQHHERCDGSGYPVGLRAEDIHPWARICAVADVFEALTGNRPYRAADSTERTLQILERMGGSELDAELVEQWKIAMTNP